MARLNLLEETRYEKLPVTVFADTTTASAAVAKRIAGVIKKNNAASKKTVLGLATGVTPVKVYDELIRLHQNEGLSFKNVITFNLDEYYPMQPGAAQSYVRFMKEHLFDHIDVDAANIHIPDGTLREEDIAAFCIIKA